MRSVTAAADAVWNRACVQARGPNHLSEPGDRALADMVLAHSLAMNGGVLHALESLSRNELIAALHGYRYFGLDSAARALEYLSEQVGDDLDDDALDRFEVEADERYTSVVRDDNALIRAFEARYSESPNDFASPRVWQADLPLGVRGVLRCPLTERGARGSGILRACRSTVRTTADRPTSLRRRVARSG